MGIVDSRGEMISPAEFESIKADGDVFQIDKKNRTTKDSETGYINRQGDLLFDPSSILRYASLRLTGAFLSNATIPGKKVPSIWKAIS